MKKNMGNIDRVLRILVALIIVTLYFMNQIIGTASIIGLVLGVIFILTGVFSFCPFYLPLKFSTRYNDKES